MKPTVRFLYLAGETLFNGCPSIKILSSELVKVEASFDADLVDE